MAQRAIPQATEQRHIPVLYQEVLDMLQARPGGRYLDGTTGLGGHSEGLIRQGGAIELVALDRDEKALELAGPRLQAACAAQGGAVHLFHLCYADFSEALDELGWKQLDGALIDIGVSSMQIDESERGFSFHADGPLDMRMDQSQTESARTLVNRWRVDELKKLIATYGEDPQAGRIARAIVDARSIKPIETTRELAAIVERAYPASWRAKARNHPATRTFQALRMQVNHELEQLEQFMNAIIRYMAPGGRVAVITFHSLEDRLVKHTMRSWAKGCICPPMLPVCQCGNKPQARILTAKPIYPTAEECARNPRAASAKLRVAEKLADQ